MTLPACNRNLVCSLAALFALLLVGSSSRAALSLYMTPEQLAERSTMIVEGTVVASEPGYDPLRSRVATYVTLDVETVHLGPDCDRLVLREAGGRIGDLILDVDAVPQYSPGERVFVFLETTKDGALRTAGMFFGKYRLVDDPHASSIQAVRDLDGKGLIFGRPSVQLEKIEIGDLIAVAAQARGASRPSVSLEPQELSRVKWQTGPEKFAPISASSPTRWAETDSGLPVLYNLERAGDPLGDPALAVAQIQRALDAWTEIPGSRVSLEFADDDFDYTGSYGASPTSSYSGTNIVLFDDPYDDIADPSGCSGVLAIAGYWRSGTLTSTVNGIDFYPALQNYVIFNNDFECFFGATDNLAEVATHEIGHSLGFGHSPVTDAIMRSSAYGGRGPRMGLDDEDAAHCHYPHTLTLLSPNGGEQWGGDSVRSILWDTTLEQGPDAGTLSIEYSDNGGQDWQSVSSDESNDGSYSWLVPGAGTDEGRIRVVRWNQIDPPPAGYPSACSSDESDASFRVVEVQPVAGTIDDGSGGSLRLDKAAGGDVRVSWGASCSSDADDHAVYQGSLASLRAGGWDTLPMSCSAGADLAEYVTPGAGNVFMLVAPLAGANEGSLGSSSSGSPRPVALSVCGVRESSSVCSGGGSSSTGPK